MVQKQICFVLKLTNRCLFAFFFFQAEYVMSINTALEEREINFNLPGNTLLIK